MVYQLAKYGGGSFENPSYYLVGFLVSFIVGFLSISVVFKFLLGRLFKVFGVYAIALGLAFLLLK
jgi:undecaprenyl pyrophosphate phosphatase UppP